MKDLKNVIKYLEKEQIRQKTTLSLIASESRIYPEALEVQSYFPLNKYVEGYIKKRFYFGCENIDEIENLAIESTKKLFNCKFANVQCLSGSIANFAVYQAFLNIGDSILSMDMKSGGHLTHSSPLSFVSNMYKVVTYSVNKKNFLIDYDEVLGIAKKYKPKLIIVGSSSYPFQICFQTFRRIADEVGAYLFADISHLSAFIASDLHPHCFPFAHVAMTTTHKQLRGSKGAIIMWNNSEFTDLINKSIFPKLQGGINCVSIAQNAISLQKNLSSEFRVYAKSALDIAKTMIIRFRELGIEVIGTDTHMFLIDTKKNFKLTGKQASEILSNSGLITNPNLIPFDSEAASVTSGIRIGTIFLCTLKPINHEIVWITDWMYKILSSGVPSPECKKEIALWVSKAYER